MHDLEKKLVKLGAIDATIESIRIDEWFENVTITYIGSGDVGKVVCDFENCLEVSLKHDKTYSKGKKDDGNQDYKYFIQDIEIIEDGEFYIFSISAWPLNGHITCKRINIYTCKSVSASV
ncbi:hypothetical protein [Clostridium sp. C8-1-8]|uniref:hypothetical protein n=1 Tax=Clostridium sp. C8-1-8 TaxID=2698831 RepID=UPI00136EE202|nr:hypothetical protein [Clostridium sp. C8-1-8]